MCNLHPLKTKSPKYCLGIFLDYNFLSDILSAKLTKFAGHFQNLAVCPTDWRLLRRLSLSPQGGAYTRALKSEKLLSPPIPVGGGGPWIQITAALMNDKIMLGRFYCINSTKHCENEENIGALYFITSPHFPTQVSYAIFGPRSSTHNLAHALRDHCLITNKIKSHALTVTPCAHSNSLTNTQLFSSLLHAH